MKATNILLLMTLAAIWGSSYLFLRIATPALGVLMTMGTRIILAALVMVILFAFLKKLPDYKQFWKQYIMLGIFNLILPFGLITYAVANLNASLGAILNATTPLFTMLVAAVWLKEKLTLKKLTGLFIGIAGLVVLVGWIPLEVNTKVILSILSSLLAALSYGVSAVYARIYLKGSDPLKTATGQISTAAVLVIPFISISVPSHPISLNITLALLVLAIVCTALGYTLYFKLLARVGATNASLVTLLVPVFSLIWSTLFLKELITPAMIMGLALVLGSLKLILAPAKLSEVVTKTSQGHRADSSQRSKAAA